MGTEIGPRMTPQTLAILERMLSAPLETWYGLQLAKECGLKTGTTSPILARLEKAGWLESEFERINPQREGRPRRRLYRLTGLGERAARARIVEAAYEAPAVSGPPHPREKTPRVPRAATT